ncbi:hypothetical protein TrVGV298_008983 [Trichoderma virens]|nr:hypothetical protein TrVGV298_008983 [Trichoderma virens]
MLVVTRSEASRLVCMSRIQDGDTRLTRARDKNIMHVYDEFRVSGLTALPCPAIDRRE